MRYGVVVVVLFCIVVTPPATAADGVKSTYIIQMDKAFIPETYGEDHARWFAGSLSSVGHEAEMLYHYKHAINGFAAHMTSEEAETFARLSGVVSVRPQRKYVLHTTRTPQFLGLDYGAHRTQRLFGDSSDVIVGLLDTGVWPHSRSFDGRGLRPVPERWRGGCVTASDFNSSFCNRKLIGAKFFSRAAEKFDGFNDVRSPLDAAGHGTHTASTAAGAAVDDASFNGFASGTARGVAPGARVAVYKTCWSNGCYSGDILAAMETAMEDGVDVLSISIGGLFAGDYISDVIAMGALAATAKGIFVSCSAGNMGPEPQTVVNVAPWLTTVAAGTIDRQFSVSVTLHDGRTFNGVSLFDGKALPERFHPIIHGVNASIRSAPGKFCLKGSLDSVKANGRIVMCEGGVGARAEKSFEVRRAGAIGVILANPADQGEGLVADANVLPSAAVGRKTASEIRKYVFRNQNPKVMIGRVRTRLAVQPSPVVAAFSSRGPNPVAMGVMKPDLLAPGVDILASWSPMAGPSEVEDDKRSAVFNVLSGTSMSCPHVSGLAALVKTRHPNWSPAAIRSALMTTAYTKYSNGRTILDSASMTPATPFDMGSGHADPDKAVDPGLVYDAHLEDYLDFVCASGYGSREELKAIVFSARANYSCNRRRRYHAGDLNYPSFSVIFNRSSDSTVSLTHRRIVTNVGPVPATYNVSVPESEAEPPVKITVKPKTLMFHKLYEKRRFSVTFRTGASRAKGTKGFSRLEWSDGNHVVSSPIAFLWI